MFLYRRRRFSGSDDGPSRRLQFGGSLLFCCAGGGNCGTFAATISPNSRIDTFAGRLHSDGSRKHRCQRLDEFFALLRAHPTAEILAATSGMRNLLDVTFTLAAIGTALAIPRLIYPRIISRLS